eukprot:m.71579 g.71579  ORF g.71579 m.71579 type:complete len:361 (+) comp14371_c2_seq4:723-1805(+)
MLLVHLVVQRLDRHSDRALLAVDSKEADGQQRHAAANNDAGQRAARQGREVARRALAGGGRAVCHRRAKDPAAAAAVTAAAVAACVAAAAKADALAHSAAAQVDAPDYKAAWPAVALPRHGTGGGGLGGGGGGLGGGGGGGGGGCSCGTGALIHGVAVAARAAVLVGAPDWQRVCLAVAGLGRRTRLAGAAPAGRACARRRARDAAGAGGGCGLGGLDGFAEADGAAVQANAPAEDGVWLAQAHARRSALPGCARGGRGHGGGRHCGGRCRRLRRRPLGLVAVCHADGRLGRGRALCVQHALTRAQRAAVGAGGPHHIRARLAVALASAQTERRGGGGGGGSGCCGRGSSSRSRGGGCGR